MNKSLISFQDIVLMEKGHWWFDSFLVNLKTQKKNNPWNNKCAENLIYHYIYAQQNQNSQNIWAVYVAINSDVKISGVNAY